MRALDHERIVPRAVAAPLPDSRKGRAWWRWLAAIALACAIAMLGAGSERPLEEHEVFVARTATEMQREGNWLLPTFNGAPRLEKPALSYWAANVAHRALGGSEAETVGERAARLPSALAGLLLIWIVFALARLVFSSRRAAIAAAVMWATTCAFAAYTRNARPEMLYAFFCCLAVLGFVRQVRGRGRGWLNVLVAWSALALALLTKGPFLPVFIVSGSFTALWLAQRRDPDGPRVRILRPWIGLSLVLVIAGGYFAFVATHVPGAVEFWRRQMFDRTGGVEGASLGLLSLPLVWSTPPLLIPWLFLIPFTAQLVWRRRDTAVRMLGISIVISLFFLSLSRRTHAYYALPVLPLACVLMGGAAVEVRKRWRGASRLEWALRIHAGLAALSAAVVATFVFMSASQMSQVGRIAIVMLCALAAGASLLAWNAAPRDAARSFLGFATSAALVLAASNAVQLGSEPERFSKAHFAKRVARTVGRDVPIVRQSGSLELLVYYGDRHVDNVEATRLSNWIATHPTGLVLAREKSIQDGSVSGRILLTESASAQPESMVLVEPFRGP